MKIESEYELVKMVEIHNTNCGFYKLYLNGKCQYDSFEADVRKVADDFKELTCILSRMEMYCPTQLLPKTKFNHIKGGKGDRKDVYEFKEGRLRVYVIVIQPNVYVVTGGYKKDQKKDIRKMMNRINGLVI